MRIGSEHDRGRGVRAAHLTEGLEHVKRPRLVARQVQERVQEGARVAVREDKAIAVRLSQSST